MEGLPFQLECKISVHKNVYTTSKPTLSDVYYGQAAATVYKASFDKKGNLIMKVRLVNNSGHYINSLKSFKITVKDANGKTVGVYKAKNKGIKLTQGGTKNLSFKIAKKALKKKNAELYGGKCDFDGSYIYNYYY